MAIPERLAPGWVVWNEEPSGRVVLAYRPDVFDTDAFPAACLPTITVAPGSSPDQPIGRRERSSSWYVAFYLEPLVRVRALDGTFDSRSAAVDRAVSLARSFSDGEVNYRDAYQVPRDTYLDKLDEFIT